MSSQPVSPTAAIFPSYTREDAEAARQIADAWRGFGVEVWFVRQWRAILGCSGMEFAARAAFGWETRPFGGQQFRVLSRTTSSPIAKRRPGT